MREGGIRLLRFASVVLFSVNICWVLSLPIAERGHSCYTDNLLAVIYGVALPEAHRLENFQFTQEFSEK